MHLHVNACPCMSLYQKFLDISFFVYSIIIYCTMPFSLLLSFLYLSLFISLPLFPFPSSFPFSFTSLSFSHFSSSFFAALKIKVVQTNREWPQQRAQCTNTCALTLGVARGMGKVGGVELQWQIGAYVMGQVSAAPHICGSR